MYKEMSNPYTHVFDYAKARNETIYPMIKSGLQDCKDGALEAFEAILEVTEPIVDELVEKMNAKHRDEIDMPLKTSQNQWRWKLYGSAGRHFGDIDKAMFLQASKEGSDASAFLS